MGTKLTDADVHTLLGQALAMASDGETDMPAYFLDLAERIALSIERQDLAARVREIKEASND